jgi:hypothetical protein
MARIPINSSCNILTEPDTKNPRAKVEITIPRLRANLSPAEAERLAEALMEAVRFVRSGMTDGLVAVNGKKVTR